MKFFICCCVNFAFCYSLEYSKAGIHISFFSGVFCAAINLYIYGVIGM
jgi:hypothetical protein